MIKAQLEQYMRENESLKRLTGDYTNNTANNTNTNTPGQLADNKKRSNASSSESGSNKFRKW